MSEPSRSAANQAPPQRWDWRAAAQRRNEAARRLPPMRCGCRDPESTVHREGRCRFRRRGER